MDKKTEIISFVERRWSCDEQLRILAEAFEPGSTAQRLRIAMVSAEACAIVDT